MPSSLDLDYASRRGSDGSSASWATLILLVAIALVGCGKSTPQPAASTQAQVDVQTNANPDPLAMTELKQAFASASPAMRVFIDETIESIRGRDFAYALAQMQKISRNAKLTPEQRAALQKATIKVQGLSQAPAGR